MCLKNTRRKIPSAGCALSRTKPVSPELIYAKHERVLRCALRRVLSYYIQVPDRQRGRLVGRFGTNSSAACPKRWQTNGHRGLH